MRAELGLRRAADLAYGLLVATTACAAALAIGAAARLLLDTGTRNGLSVGPKDREPAVEQTSRARIDYSVIFERNLFGSEPIVVTAAGAGARTDLLLRGTAEFAGNGYAVFENTESGDQRLFGMGETVFDGPKLVAVDMRTATLLHGNRRLVVEITESEASGANSTLAGPAAGKASEGIRQVADNRYVVDRGEVDHSIENLSTVITQMRAVPYLKDGKSVGFRVFNIRAGSVFERMGIKNGDVIQSVNGTTLDDPTRALALLDEVQGADEISIDLLRGDRPSTLTYSIR